MSTELSPEEREAMERRRDALYPPPCNPRHVDAIDVARHDAFEDGFLAAREYSKQREGKLEREHADLLERTHDVIWKRFEQREQKSREALKRAEVLLGRSRPWTLTEEERETWNDTRLAIRDALAENGDTDD